MILDLKAQMKISSDDVMIGSRSITDIFDAIYSKAEKCVLDISMESQKEDPDYNDIDSPLHGILNLIDEIRKAV